MLHHLKIHNLATIQNLELDFQQGFSILTGETGAGKSIIIDAIHLVTGKKADYSLIRSGEPQALVEATFDINALPNAQQILNDSDIPYEEELIIRRIIQKNNRQKVFINGVSSTRLKLEEIGRLLVNIHGQHDNQALLQASTHIDFLDGFGKLLGLREKVQSLFNDYQKAIQAYEEFKQFEAQKAQKIEELTFQKAEIEHLDLQENEEETLTEEANILSHAATLSFIFAQTQNELYEREGSLIERLEALQRSFIDAEKLDPGCSEFRQGIESCLIQMEDLQRGVSRHASKYHEDPEKLEWVNQRLSQIQTLKRKYGFSIKDILAHLKQVTEQLEQLQNPEESEEALLEKKIVIQKELHLQSESLSSKRKNIAKKLDRLVIKELHQLGMEKAIFETQISPKTATEADSNLYHYSANGIDSVEFALSVNPGQELRSLVKVASGGELSRIMLALKTVLISIDSVETMIFDEIDNGISGRVAEMVGQKLRSLGEAQQALCVTHLPQIAAFSQHHFSISKNITKNETFTSIQELTTDEKVQELARLMGGSEITPQTLKLASEMLERTNQK